MSALTKDQLLDEIIENSHAIVGEKNVDSLLERTALLAKKIANAQGLNFFNILDDNKIHSYLVINDALNMHLGGTAGSAADAAPINIMDPGTNLPNMRNLCAGAVLNRKTLNIADVYASTLYDISAIKAFDEKNDFSTKSTLTIPLFNRQNRPLAVLQLINARDENGLVTEFSPESQNVIEMLVNQLALAYENLKLINSERHVMESFISIIAQAIDVKSPYTSAHCQRVPVLVRMLATAACMSKAPAFEKFQMTDDQWYALHLASWLHDSGKITIPEYIIDKATKLETVYNRIHEIRMRFEVLRRDAHINYLKKRLKGADPDTLKAEYDAVIKQLDDDFLFVADCNIGDIPLEDSAQQRLREIAKKTWTRNYDKYVGLSWEEASKVTSHSRDLPAQEFLIDDSKDNFFLGCNRSELHNLMVKNGTVTEEEMNKIKSHVSVTIDMLNSIPFPPNLEEVREYAGSHHERIDGKGYPGGLTKFQMSVPARIMAIADVFEALTATDRPYKKAKTLSECLDIMQDMVNTGHIDSDLFSLFVRSGVYKEYAALYLRQDQIDHIELSKYISDSALEQDYDD